ncbi:MAG: acyl--CoA ligase, partial [Candidatus Melainabacteria bacterium]|nr:acyl--CoA ligase [Candidatus Melainabacteria bacterium]
MLNLSQAVLRILSPVLDAPAHGQRPALIVGSKDSDSSQDMVFTVCDIDNLIGRAQAALEQAGVGRGKIVLLCAPNSPELVACLIATWRLGAIALPVDFRLTKGEVENIAVRVCAKVIYSSEPLTEIIETIVPQKFPSQPASYDAHRACMLDLDLPALIILTSGTTGVPKGAVHDLG